MQTFTCIMFFPFPGLTKSESFHMFGACTNSSSTLDFFSVVAFYLAVSASSNRSIKSCSASSISIRLGAIPDALSSAPHFDLYFFANRLYQSGTDLGVTLKKHSSTSELKIAISSHACPFLHFNGGVSRVECAEFLSKINVMLVNPGY